MAEDRYTSPIFPLPLLLGYIQGQLSNVYFCLRAFSGYSSPRCKGLMIPPTTTSAWVLSCFSHLQPFVTLWTVAQKAPLSMGFSRQEYWSGLPFLLQGIFLTQGLHPVSLRLLHWQAGSLPLAPPKNPYCPQWLSTNDWREVGEKSPIPLPLGGITLRCVSYIYFQDFKARLNPSDL